MTRSVRNASVAPLLLALLLLVAGCAEQEESPPVADVAAATDVLGGLDVEGLGYASGLENAPVTVIEFSDFGCPYCAQFALNTYPDIHNEFVSSGRVRWIYIPFVIGRFQNGDRAALAAECAGEQDRFWPMHDALYERQSDWRRPGAVDDLMMEIAAGVSLNAERFAQCYQSEAPAARIERHNALARQAGVRGTPTFLVNGRPIAGALPPEHFQTLLEWAVASAR